MLKREEVEVAYYSKQAFYTIKGVGFVKTMTLDHTGVRCHNRHQSVHLRNYDA